MAGETNTSSPTSATPDTGGELYAEFIRSELKDEQERRSTLDARSTSVITTSGSFVTLTFALSALLTGAKGFKPSVWTVVFLVLALCAFVAAAAFALLANRLFAYCVAAVEQLHEWRDDRFWLDKDNARWLLADANTLRCSVKAKPLRGGLRLPACRQAGPALTDRLRE